MPSNTCVYYTLTACETHHLIPPLSHYRTRTGKICGIWTLSAVWEEQSEQLILEQVLGAPDELTFSFGITRKGDS